MKLKHDSAIRPTAIRLIHATTTLALMAPLALAQPVAAPTAEHQHPQAATAPAGGEPTATEHAAQSASTRTPSDQAASANTEATHSSPARGDASVDLGPLLDGVEQQCRYNAVLERFWRDLSQPEQALGVLDQTLKGAVGDILVTDEADFRMYSIPVRGTWHQVPVSQIQFGLGKGNGIHVLLVEFDAAPQQARAVFEPLVTRSKLAMSQDPDNTLDATTDLVIDGGKARLICDLST